MAAKSFRCRLITPAAQLLDEPVMYASVPAWDGLFGVMPDRAPIVAKLGIGELRLDFADKGSAKGGSRSYLVDDGFVQMVNNKLTILAGKAIPTETLNIQEAEAELRAAEARQPAAADPKERRAEQDRITHDRDLARAKVRLAQASGGRAI